MVVAALQRTRMALGLAALVVLPVLAITARDTARFVAPTCDLSLERAPYSRAVPIAVQDRAESVLSLGAPIPHAPGHWIDQSSEHDDLQRASAVTGSVLVLRRRDGVEPLSCGSVRLDARGVGDDGGSLLRRASGDYAYIDARYADASQDAVRVVTGARRHVQSARILRSANLPFGLALLSSLVLAAAALRARRGLRYVTRIRHWREAELHEGGHLESEGTTLGVLEDAARDSLTGPVLVAPDALASASSYRDLPRIARQHAARGTHAEWSNATRRRFRAARLLAALATGSALLASVARALAS